MYLYNHVMFALIGKATLSVSLAVVEPGFPRLQAPTPREGDSQPIIWPFFPRKLHKNERNWTAREVHIPLYLPINNGSRGPRVEGRGHDPILYES